MSIQETEMQNSPSWYGRLGYGLGGYFLANIFMNCICWVAIWAIYAVGIEGPAAGFLGLLAFGIAIYWTILVQRERKYKATKTGMGVAMALAIIGFTASLVTS